MLTEFHIVTRLAAAFILGGIIGIEREGISKPAGLRTHILVSVSSALIMLTGIYLFEIYYTKAQFDPTRLGAQVISGIGFLGAGTILKVNNSVKGLTTAASLWSVAGIGIACGMGFYSGAIACTLLILFSLIVFSRVELLIDRNKHLFYIYIICKSILKELGFITTELEKKHIQIKQIEISNTSSNNLSEIIILIKAPKGIKIEDIIEFIKLVDGVESVKFKR